MTKRHRRRLSRAKHHLPKGAHPLPSGNYVVSTTHVTSRGRTMRVRGVRRGELDAKRVARVLIHIAVEHATGSHEAHDSPGEPDPRGRRVPSIERMFAVS